MSQDQTGRTRPRSVTSPWVSLASAVVFVATVMVAHRSGLDLTQVFFVGLGALVGFQAALDLIVLRVHLRPSTGLVFRKEHFRNNFSLGRSLIKLGGLVATLAALALLYWLVPMYSKGFHAPFWRVLSVVAPYLAALTIPYFILIDSLMAKPKDGYWHAANFVALRFEHVDWRILREHALGWVIKGFFLPLMLPLFVNALERFARFPEVWPWVYFVYYVAALALCLDLAFVVIGYTFTFRILDSHIRNANPYLIGWVACLMCYRPFWNVVGLRYGDGAYWIHWFEGSAPLIFTWGLLVIVAKCGWAWSNIIFGFRFSNLTHRGIITGGAYRLTKHPSYIFKNIGWWLINVPFLSSAGTMDAVTHSVMLLCVNFIYFVRARTEELHLSRDPVYVAYAEWVNEHGVFRWLARLIPSLRYHAPLPLQPKAEKTT